MGSRRICSRITSNEDADDNLSAALAIAPILPWCRKCCRALATHSLALTEIARADSHSRKAVDIPRNLLRITRSAIPAERITQASSRRKCDSEISSGDCLTQINSPLYRDLRTSSFANRYPCTIEASLRVALI